MATKKTTKTAAKKTTKITNKPVKSTKPVKKDEEIKEKSIPAVKEERAQTRQTETTAPSKNSTGGIKIRKSQIILILVIIGIGAFIYLFRGLFVAAVVNGQPISRLTVVQEAEKQSGKQALETLVRNNLIEQEARKQKVTVSEKEIDDEIKKVEEQLAKQGQKIDDVLKLQGMSRENLRELIRLDKLVGKIVGKDIKVEDKEVEKYIEENKEMLPADQKEDELKKSVKEQLHQQKLNEKVRTWLEDLQKKANIMDFVQY